MKIAIASDDQRQVSQHFGRCRGFVVYEVNESKAAKVEYRANDGACGHEGSSLPGAKDEGHAKKARGFSDCGVVIAGGMGPGMRVALENAGIRSIVTDKQSVEETLSAFLLGELKDGARHECRHGHGGGEGRC